MPKITKQNSVKFNPSTKIKSTEAIAKDKGYNLRKSTCIQVIHEMEIVTTSVKELEQKG